MPNNDLVKDVRLSCKRRPSEFALSRWKYIFFIHIENPFPDGLQAPAKARERPVKSGTVIHFRESRFRHTSVQTRANFYVIFNGANRVFVRS